MRKPRSGDRWKHAGDDHTCRRSAACRVGEIFFLGLKPEAGACRGSATGQTPFLLRFVTHDDAL